MSRNRTRSYSAVVVLALASLAGLAPGEEPAVRFVSIPDLINADVEYNAGRCFDLDETADDYAARRQEILDARGYAGHPLIPSHPGDLNGDGVLSVQEGYRGAMQVMLESAAAEGAGFITVSGDLVDGEWATVRWKQSGEADLATKQQHIRTQGDLYYDAWKQHVADAGISRAYSVVGDHEIGDNNWGSAKAQLVPTFLDLYGEKMQMPSTVAAGGYVDAPDRYRDQGRVYARQEGNTLIVGVETFDMDYDEAGNITAVNASSPGEPPKRSNVPQDQVDWLADTLAQAKTDPAIEHTVVLGHMPADVPGVNKANSSNLRIADGAESDFWQALAEGDADLYLAGEVHAASAAHAYGVTQVVGAGNFFGGATKTEYTVVDVYEDRIELTLKRADRIFNGDRSDASDPVNDDNSKSREWRIAAGDSFYTVGTMTLDTSSGAPRVAGTTGVLRSAFHDLDAATPQHARFDIGDRNSSLAAGWVKLSGERYTGTSLEVDIYCDGQSSALQTDSGHDMDVVLDGEQAGDMLKDHVFANKFRDATYLDILVEGEDLPAGEYLLRAFFHDENAWDGQTASMMVIHGGAFASAGTTEVSSGLSPQSVGLIEHTLTTDGSSNVILRIDSNDDKKILISGLEIVQVPEPATLGLLGLGAAGLLARCRRRAA